MELQAGQACRSSCASAGAGGPRGTYQDSVGPGMGEGKGVIPGEACSPPSLQPSQDTGALAAQLQGPEEWLNSGLLALGSQIHRAGWQLW